MTKIIKSLIQNAQGEMLPFVHVRIRTLLLHQIEHIFFYCADSLQYPAGIVAAFGTQVGSHQYAFSDQTGLGHVVQDTEHALGIGLILTVFQLGRDGLTHTGQFCQRISAHALVRVAVDQGFEQSLPLPPAGRRQVEFVHPGAGLVHGTKNRFALKDPGTVRVALHKSGAFQPGNGRFYLGVSLDIVAVKFGINLLVTEQFAGSDDYLVVLISSRPSQSA